MFAYVMQSYEDRILRIIVRALRDKGWTVSSLQFDGVYVRARPGVRATAHGNATTHTRRRAARARDSRVVQECIYRACML